jgi:hypothetical protein
MSNCGVVPRARIRHPRVVMTPEERNLVFDICAARRRAEALDQELSELSHLLHGFVVVLVATGRANVQEAVRTTLGEKILQLPQGCRIGRRLIEIDRQCGGLLEEMGIPLERWVNAPRHGANGQD